MSDCRQDVQADGRNILPAGYDLRGVAGLHPLRADAEPDEFALDRLGAIACEAGQADSATSWFTTRASNTDR